MKIIIIVHFMLVLFHTTFGQTEWTTSGVNINNTNSGNVGIGITTPTEKLTVAGNIRLDGGIYWDWPNRIIEQYADSDGVSRMIRFRNSMGESQGNPNGGFDFADYAGASVLRINNSNVGIGMATPTEKLTVAGNIRLNGKIFWGWPDRAIEENVEPDGVSTTIRFRNSMGEGQGNPNGGFDFADYTGSSVMRIVNNCVGIGTSNPGTFKLAVEGKIGAREVRVTNANPWPDYVFKPRYSLPSLQFIEQYIKQNGHLPEVPSAQEIKRDGYNMSEMDAALLKKIEELTLHLIELNKKVEVLTRENKRLSNSSH